MKPFVSNLKKRSVVLKCEALFSFFCLFFILCYRMCLSPHLGGACRFSPSCSLYAWRVFQDQKSPWKACLFVLKRLGKCHPFGRSFSYGLFPFKNSQAKLPSVKSLQEGFVHERK